MGALRMCAGKRAEDPYYFAPTGINIYTAEELCWHIYSNSCLTDEKIMNEELFDWIERQLGLPLLAQELRLVRNKYNDYSRTAVRLLEKAGCLSAERIIAFEKEMDSLRDKTPMERLKIRSDRLLEKGKIKQAALGYLRLLEDDCTVRMTEELCGNIYHNLGVCYARLFMFTEAADCFKAAVKKRASQESLSCYLYSLSFLEDYDDSEDGSLRIDYASSSKAVNRVKAVSGEEKYNIERKRIEASAGRSGGGERTQEILSDWLNRYANMMS